MTDFLPASQLLSLVHNSTSISLMKLAAKGEVNSKKIFMTCSSKNQSDQQIKTKTQCFVVVCLLMF